MPDPELAWANARLRPWSADDAPVLVEAWNDTDVAAFNPVPADRSPAVARKWIAGCALRRRRRLSIDLVIDFDGEVVGEVGLSGFEYGPARALIGYWLLGSARGRGLATEAVRRMTSWSFATLELDHLIALCHPANEASHRVAERAGYSLTGSDHDGLQRWTLDRSDHRSG